MGEILAFEHVGGPLPRLSDREREILRLVADGLSNRAIAERLSVSERTVESHISRTLMKLDIPDTAGHHRRVLAVLVFLGVRPSRDELLRPA